MYQLLIWLWNAHRWQLHPAVPAVGPALSGAASFPLHWGGTLGQGAGTCIRTVNACQEDDKKAKQTGRPRALVQQAARGLLLSACSPTRQPVLCHTSHASMHALADACCDSRQDEPGQGGQGFQHGRGLWLDRYEVRVHHKVAAAMRMWHPGPALCEQLPAVK